MTTPNPQSLKPLVLSAERHDRDVAGFRYVYPVLSRRSGGVSIGINLNPNNACNWRCVYCQVPGLVRGSGPAVDLDLLAQELSQLLTGIATGSVLDSSVPLERRTIRDFALSGNGEPTSSPQLAEVIELVGTFKSQDQALAPQPLVLITNGSLADQERVKTAIRRLADWGGTVWFKLDRGSDGGMSAVNSTSTRFARHLSRLKTVAQLCPTWVQSCWFTFDGQMPSATDRDEFVAAIASTIGEGTSLAGVQLYTVARESHQPESARLGPVSDAWLRELAAPLEALGLCVNIAA